jgi:nucleoid DNA-binding protein
MYKVIKGFVKKITRAITEELENAILKMGKYRVSQRKTRTVAFFGDKFSKN